MNNWCFELNKSLFNIDGGGGCENYEEVANFAALPATGDEDTTYKTLDDGKIFEWNGTEYVELSVQTTPIGATLMKTGQTTSYRTGDDGDIEAGREVDFFTLSANNPFGNNKRFTGITGGYQIGGVNYNKDGGTTTAALAFPNDIVIDWSTTKSDGTKVLGYKRTLEISSIWNTAIDNSLTASVGSFTSGWRMINRNETFNIMSPSASPFNFNPFNLVGVNINTSTTWIDNSAYSWAWIGLSGQFTFYIKSNTGSQYMMVRTFTVTGTTLT